MPFPAGGAGDSVARSVALGLGEAFKQSVIVDNKPGAGGVIGADAVAKAMPDGYTEVITTRGSLSAIREGALKRLQAGGVTK